MFLCHDRAIIMPLSVNHNLCLYKYSKPPTTKAHIKSRERGEKKEDQMKLKELRWKAATEELLNKISLNELPLKCPSGLDD